MKLECLDVIFDRSTCGFMVAPSSIHKHTPETPNQ